MSFTSNAQNELNKLKDSVIGIYKYDNLFYLITEYNDKTMNGIRVTQFGAIQQFYGMPLRGHYQEFPNKQTMNELLEKPHEWTKFIDSFL